jgi:RNA polymerase sigma-70 factor (ECF subfamily)
MMEEDLDTWFVREVLSHEAALMRYLTRTWSNRDDVHDLRQETYVRVYEAAAKSRPLAAKSFLFTTARHLMADRVRRERIVSIEPTGDLEALNVSVDEISPEQRVNARQELRRLADAFDLLPPKCRAAVWMRKVEGLSQREVAARLGVREGTVEKHITKGIRILASVFYGDDVACGDVAVLGVAAAEGAVDDARKDTRDARRDLKSCELASTDAMRGNDAARGTEIRGEHGQLRD